MTLPGRGDVCSTQHRTRGSAESARPVTQAPRQRYHRDGPGRQIRDDIVADAIRCNVQELADGGIHVLRRLSQPDRLRGPLRQAISASQRTPPAVAWRARARRLRGLRGPCARPPAPSPSRWPRRSPGGTASAARGAWQTGHSSSLEWQSPGDVDAASSRMTMGGATESSAGRCARVPRRPARDSQGGVTTCARSGQHHRRGVGATDNVDAGSSTRSLSICAARRSAPPSP